MYSCWLLFLSDCGAICCVDPVFIISFFFAFILYKFYSWEKVVLLFIRWTSSRCFNKNKKKKQNNQIERKKLYQNIPQFLVCIYARKSVCICNMFVFWFIRKILVAFSPLCYDLSVVCMNMKHFSDLNQQQNVIFRKSDNFFFLHLYSTSQEYYEYLHTFFVFRSFF